MPSSNQDSNFWAQYLRENEDRWCRALSQLLRYDTVSGDPDPRAYQYWRGRIAEGFEFLYGLAKEFGLATRYYDKRVLVMEVPGPTGGPVLGFPIHLDVVPAGEGWTRPPFGGEISQRAIWGRGAQDDKGPIIQVLFGLIGAIEMARRTNRGFRKTVRIIVVSEEELGIWDDIPFYFEREKPPDFSIVPDAHFPITNGEKGVINLTIDAAWSSPLPGAFELWAGERANVVPARANLKAGAELRGGLDGADWIARQCAHPPKPPTVKTESQFIGAEFHGVGSHGSTPQKGYSAALDALRAANALPGLKGHPAGRALDWLVRAGESLSGEFLGIAAHHPKVGGTTVNLGVLRADRSSARAVLNIRTPLGLSCAEVEKRVRASATEWATNGGGSPVMTVSGEAGSREAIYLDPNQFADWIEPMRDAYTDATGRDAGLQSIGGTTFAKAFPNAVCFGPVDPSDGEPELAHEKDEHVTLAAMRRNVEIYGRTIANLAL